VDGIPGRELLPGQDLLDSISHFISSTHLFSFAGLPAIPSTGQRCALPTSSRDMLGCLATCARLEGGRCCGKKLWLLPCARSAAPGAERGRVGEEQADARSAEAVVGSKGREGGIDWPPSLLASRSAESSWKSNQPRLATPLGWHAVVAFAADIAAIDAARGRLPTGCAT